MNFLFSFQTRKRTFIIGNKTKKNGITFLVMIVGIVHKLLEIGVSLDDIYYCVEAGKRIYENGVENIEK